MLRFIALYLSLALCFASPFPVGAVGYEKALPAMSAHADKTDDCGMCCEDTSFADHCRLACSAALPTNGVTDLALSVAEIDFPELVGSTSSLLWSPEPPPPRS